MLGMHRSGTSLITRMLNVLGVYLGPDERLMNAQEHNPRGFWEHQLITDLNNAILAQLGGSWDEPPTFFPGWESAPELADLRQKARVVIHEDFAATECWGWKDPRTCLTLRFWQGLLHPMRYLLCLRNPVDVAQSLYRRDGFSAEKSVRLWLTYVASALAHTAGQPRLLLFYEDVMRNPQAELRRLARFVDAPELAEADTTQSAVREFVEEETGRQLMEALRPEVSMGTVVAAVQAWFRFFSTTFNLVNWLEIRLPEMMQPAEMTESSACPHRRPSSAKTNFAGGACT